MSEKLKKEINDILQSEKYTEKTSYYTPSFTGIENIYSTANRYTGGRIEIKHKVFEVSENVLKRWLSLIDG